MTKLKLNGQIACLTVAVAAIVTPISANAQSGVKSADDRVAAAVGHALQADARQALAQLRSVPEGGLIPADEAFRSCMIARFGDGAVKPLSAHKSRLSSDELVALFRSYWRRSLLDPKTRDQEENALQQTLSRAFNVAADWSAIEGAIQAQLAREGRYGLLGRTGALRELMVWRRQRETVEPVRLPEGPFKVRVVYLEDFASLGWGDWATCGRRGAGGWATSDGLFAVTPRYASLTGEEFQVTFLGHEAQHFADLSRYPNVASWELEYRAKLVELAQVRVTRTRVLRKFLEDQSNDPAQPHGYANRRVLQGLAARLRLDPGSAMLSVEPKALNEAALELLRMDSRARAATPHQK